MASTKVRERPAAQPTDTYDSDFYAWTIDQAAALREGRLSELDIANLAEEIEDLGKEVFAKLTSSYRIVLIHMLKWDNQAERRSRSWFLSIRTHRNDLSHLLRDNPGLKSRRMEALHRAYLNARLEAADQTGLDEAIFPEACPYTLDDILNRPFEWPET